jgi:hypothetical protein
MVRIVVVVVVGSATASAVVCFVILQEWLLAGNTTWICVDPCVFTIGTNQGCLPELIHRVSVARVWGKGSVLSAS